MRILIAMLLWISSFSVFAAHSVYDVSHAAWNRLLVANVSWNAAGTATSVDCAGFARDSGALRGYLRSLSMVNDRQFRQWNQPERDAFLINAYNAATVQLVLTRYPDLGSIKDGCTGTRCSCRGTPARRPDAHLVSRLRLDLGPSGDASVIAAYPVHS